MALTTYAELVASAIDWSNRGDLSARMPDFIRLAEERIWRGLRVSAMIKVATLTVPSGQNYVALPFDWLEFKRVRTTTEARIEYMPVDELEDLPLPGSKYAYSIEGGRFIYGTIPAANQAFSIRYYGSEPALSTTSTNWLLTAAPSVYLYATLIEVALFVKDVEAAGRWGTLMDKAVGEMEGADAAAVISGSALRMRTR